MPWEDLWVPMGPWEDLWVPSGCPGSTSGTLGGPMGALWGTERTFGCPLRSLYDQWVLWEDLWVPYGALGGPLGALWVPWEDQ